jgi:hypothetical protein
MKRYSPILLLALPLFGCGTTGESNTEYAQPNGLMGKEIDRRVQDISFQHRDELYNNLLWLAQRGEVAVPALLNGLQNSEPKVRSSCAWVLGRIGDRRTIGDLKKLTTDPQETVRLEVARSLVEMGDVSQCPMLIGALDSDKVQVRAMVHEALKRATGRDFGFDHLSDNVEQRKLAVLRWRQWWGQLAGDPFFATQYAQQNQLAAPGAVPLGETSPPAGNTQQQQGQPQSFDQQPAPASRPQPGGEIPR